MDVNVRTGSGTALHEAAQCGKTEVARTLLDHGINTHIRDVHRRTVEDLLRQFPPKAGPAVEISAMLQSMQITGAWTLVLIDFNCVLSPLKIISSTITTKVIWKLKGGVKIVILCLYLH